MEDPEKRSEQPIPIMWSDYVRYRARTRGFDLSIVEQIVRFSQERYHDTETGSRIAVGRHKGDLVLVAYDIAEGGYHPITIHATTRNQIASRLNSGRYAYE